MPRLPMLCMRGKRKWPAVQASNNPHVLSNGVSCLAEYMARHRCVCIRCMPPCMQVPPIVPQPLRHAGYPVALGTRPGATAAGRSYTIQPRSHAREDRTTPSHRLRWRGHSTLIKPCDGPSCRHSVSTSPEKQVHRGRANRPAPGPDPRPLHNRESRQGPTAPPTPVSPCPKLQPARMHKRDPIKGPDFAQLLFHKASRFHPPPNLCERTRAVARWHASLLRLCGCAHTSV